ncbi:hypothetical protein ACFC6U_02590 [Kitasatospora purpeofusca]|uniref:hypothetical protein n=1 Tax=Kitasatospora purpeofusca TaxID=67352 RepID=UPI0035DDCBE2
MQRIGQPNRPIRLTVSGIAPDPTTGETPPPVLELRFNRRLLAALGQQIQDILAQHAEEPEPEGSPLVRRKPGQFLQEQLTPEEIEERRGTWTGAGVSAENLKRFRDGLRRAEATT